MTIQGETVLRASCLTIAVIAGAGLAASSEVVERYVRASVDGDNLLIVTDDGRTTTIKKEGNQVGFDQIKISPAGNAVGWVGMRVNCCTSYDIPTRLFVLSAGAVRRYDGIGLPVWKWAFSDDGKHVSFHQETVHGGLGVHYELRNVTTGRLVAKFEPAVDRDNQPIPGQRVPAWVTALKAKPR